MKYFTLFCVAALAVACGSPQKKTENKSTTKEEPRETVLGDFNGDGKQESAMLFQLSGDDTNVCNVCFSSDSIKPIESCMIEFSAKYMTNEGDLNNDGADDIGLFLYSGESYWGTYAVYSYAGGEWKELLSYGHNPGWNDVPIQELVSKHPSRPCCVIIKEISLDQPEMLERVIEL
jgi:hypothetical protein